MTLINTENAALTITSIAASGDFSETNTCGSIVAAGANCMISITFTPTAGGNRTGTLTITDNAHGSPQTVALTGTGEDFSMTMPSGSSSTASINPGQTATYSLSLSGLGGLNQTINSLRGSTPRGHLHGQPLLRHPSASGPVAITVTVATTAPTLVVPNPRSTPPPCLRMDGRMITLLLMGLLMLAALASGFVGRQPHSEKLDWGSGLALLGMLALAMTACGGGGGGGSQNPGTPAGTYTLTVTGSASGSASLQHSMALTLKVG